MDACVPSEGGRTEDIRISWHTVLYHYIPCVRVQNHGVDDST